MLIINIRKWRIIHFTVFEANIWHFSEKQFDHGITTDGNTVIVTKYQKKWPKITAENSLRILLFTWCLKEYCVKICLSAFDLHSCACNYFHAKESKNNNPPLFNVFLLSLKCISMFCKEVFDFYQKSN